MNSFKNMYNTFFTNTDIKDIYIWICYDNTKNSIKVPISDINWDEVTYINAYCSGLTNCKWLQNAPKLTHLILNDNLITSLEGIPEYSQLETLILSHNYITSLEYLPKSWPNLNIFAITHNKLSSLSGFPDDCPNLKHLSINDNYYNTLEGLPISKLNKLEVYCADI